MIFHPRVGQRVRVHYNRHVAHLMPYHGQDGVVRVISRGGGPRNVGVELAGRMVVIPRGNLVAIGPNEKTPAGAGVVDEEGANEATAPR